jgi:hypothetical protein
MMLPMRMLSTSGRGVGSPVRVGREGRPKDLKDSCPLFGRANLGESTCGGG